MDININALDLRELKALRSKLDRAIDGYGAKQKQKALEAIKVAAQEHGFALKDLLSEDIQKSTAVAPKYAHPKNPDQTWTGRGRKPRWVQEALDAGKSLDDLAI
ncbi:H-NS histone family protein [Paracoccus sp. CPCC 101403]|uniref:H-NS histone family protein n=1 Tax=Paracoccus broussonetiae TaxID=3075834 RepID=A0ABU3EIV5_9RHOB|nr:H-NS histone family protein [Paracoccus sp. CPCC 101403]MDT1064181.1 H-NS histone family protein [Paracoccus sp. CPCC 101403]